ncbi:MAG: hypothetical protein ABIH25_01865 [Candidatus Woesearchaeota archaeon]
MKKGQLQIQETGFVIFIVVVILLIGFVLFYQFQIRSIENLNEKYQEDKFEDMISFVPSMPELSYSVRGDQKGSIDFYKARAFADVSDNEYYKNLFGYKKITLKVSADTLVLYDNKLSSYTGIRKITSPVSVYNAWDEKYYVGVLEVERYV